MNDTRSRRLSSGAVDPQQDRYSSKHISHTVACTCIHMHMYHIHVVVVVVVARLVQMCIE